MKSFLEYLIEERETINEYNFQYRDFSHKSYLSSIIKLITSGGELSLGRYSVSSIVDFSKRKNKKIASQLSAVVQYEEPTEEIMKFNAIASSADPPFKFQEIYKQPFSKATNRTEDEISTVNSLSAQLSNGPLQVKCMGSVYEIESVEKVPGTPKADIVLKDTDGKERIWISLKKGTSVKQFGGYGGISKLYLKIAKKEGAIKESDINAVYSFVNALSSALDGKTIDKVYFSETVPKNLQIASLYGYDWKKTEYSSHNCQYVAQGNVRLEKKGKYWQLTADHLLENPKLPIDENYKPVFVARKSNDRNDFKLKGVRVGIFPKAYAINRNHEELSV